MTRVVVIGECMVERREGGEETFAGDAFNVAAHLKAAAPDFEVFFASVTGEDALSWRMRQAWATLGIDGSLSSAVRGGRVGVYTVETNSSGERRFSYDRATSAARRWFAELSGRAQAMAGADLVFLTGVSLAILSPEERIAALAFIGSLRPGIIAFDPNVRLALWESRETMLATLQAAIARSDIVLPSLDDLTEIWGEATPEDQIQRRLARSEVALTLGPKGCLVALKDGSMRRSPASAGPVIDTAGAGDAFDGAYLAARLAGIAPEGAAQAGLDLAHRVVALRGALPLELFPCR